MTKEQMLKKAVSAYGNQKTRCNNPNCDRYPFYGGKGIRVEYSWVEFRDWYLKNAAKFVGEKPSVGRIDHNKNYTLRNIEIQSIYDNVSERNSRHGPPTKKIMVVGVNKITGRRRVFESSYHAELMTGIDNNTVMRAIRTKNGALKPKKSCRYYDFYFYKDING